MWTPRASTVGSLMASPEKSKIPDGGMSYLENELSKLILEWEDEMDFRTLQKGLMVEDQSIELYNDVFFTNYVKNTERKTTAYLTGECDIDDEDSSLILDIKSAFSKKSFPMVLHLTGRKGYEWQLRSYMHLWDRNKAQLAYCLVNTPYELIGNDPENWHIVDSINPVFRVSTINLKRDSTKEAQLLDRIRISQDWMNEALDKRGYKFAIEGLAA